jgi:hypothetical protein
VPFPGRAQQSTIPKPPILSKFIGAAGVIATGGAIITIIAGTIVDPASTFTFADSQRSPGTNRRGYALRRRGC